MQDSPTVELLWTTLGALLTLATFSFLYRDNPLYKFAEHLVVGVSAGYFFVLLIHSSLIPTLFLKIGDGQYAYFIPGFLGMAMWFRFSRKLSWISRYPIACYIGIGAGVAIPLYMYNNVNRQLSSTLDLSLGFGSGVEFWNIVIVIGVLAALVYFFFSKEHKGAFGGFAKFGIYILMIGFGASFGYTIMARISLFVQRIASLQAWVNMLLDYFA
jgi:Na+-transporting NADH:ubiquinone oxidoreductase subunit NqrE